MKIKAPLIGTLADVPEKAKEIETLGYDGLFSAEIANDPFFPLLIAAEHTERVEIMTAIAVAFARNPMTLANLSHDLNAYSGGRFTLGLGSQIRPHITRRMSMPWSKPASRMREFILAMQAVWKCWYEGAPLDFRGEFYTHTLMTPMFTPTDIEHGAPRLMLAAVGPKMTEVAGEVADGLIAHAFTTKRYMQEVTIPALERGLAKAGRSRADFEIACPSFVVTGADAEARAGSEEAIRRQIAFYGSTPAYRPVLEMHGWGELQTELNVLSKRGEWVEMGNRITDEMLDEFAIVTEPAAVTDALLGRYGGLIDSVLCTFGLPDADGQRAAVERLQAG
jgi:probable F420-dependent oxidoreductase